MSPIRPICRQTLQCRETHQCRQHCSHSHAPSCAHQRLHNQQHQNPRHKKVKPIHTKPLRWRAARIKILGLHREPHFRQTFAECTERFVTSLRRLRDGSQRRLVQMTANHFAFRVTNEFLLALLVCHADFSARFGAHADGEHHHVRLRQTRRDLHATLLQILAVGDQYDDFFTIHLFHRAERFIQRTPHIRAGYDD